MNLVETLKFLAPKLEGNMKVTNNDYRCYSVKCYGVDNYGCYTVITADVVGDTHGNDCTIYDFKVVVDDDIENELPAKELMRVFCDGFVDPTGVEKLEMGHSMLFELS